MAEMEKRIARFIEPFRVDPGSSVKLAQDFDPAFEAGVKKKADGVELLQDGIQLLSEYQARLAAQDTNGVLVVLQALDVASGATNTEIADDLHISVRTVESHVSSLLAKLGSESRAGLIAAGIATRP